MKLNAKKILMEYNNMNSSVIKNLPKREKKVFLEVKKNPGIERDSLALKSGLTLKETDNSIFRLAKTGLIHIVNENIIYPTI